MEESPETAPPPLVWFHNGDCCCHDNTTGSSEECLGTAGLPHVDNITAKGSQSERTEFRISEARSSL